MSRIGNNPISASNAEPAVRSTEIPILGNGPRSRTLWGCGGREWPRSADAACVLPPGPPAAFTLIELILVMTMMAVLLAIVAPSLARFFRSRNLESEAKRFLALTRYAQSRAVSEGLPVVLWIDSKQRAYGLQADSSYVTWDTNAVEFTLAENLEVEVDQSALASRRATLWKGNTGLGSNLPNIRFTPDGFISDTSPEYIVFRQTDEGELWIGPSRNHLSYEICTNRFVALRR